jgi:hypothetical protein
MPRVRITVEYTPVLPVELRDEYRSTPKVETFEFYFKCDDEKKLQHWSRRRAFRTLLERDEVCEMIKMLNLELC